MQKGVRTFHTAVLEAFGALERAATCGGISYSPSGSTNASSISLTAEQQLFLAPFVRNDEGEPTALFVAADRLSSCFESRCMPLLPAVGLLTDDSTLLGLVQSFGDEWLRKTADGCSTDIGQAIFNLCVGNLLFLEENKSQENTQPITLGFTGDAASTVAAILANPQTGNPILCRLIAARLLFNCRVTVGTVTAIGVLGYSLPPRKCLEASFELPHCPPREIISVGARALAKHTHRDSSSWWGNHHMKGSQQCKNAAANAVLARILNDVDAVGSHSWRNYHVLPHGFVAYECRVASGHGARWQTAVAHGAALQFRGFLEPHDEDGHSNGWRH